MQSPITSNKCSEEVIKKTGLSEFELSGNYLAFFDKLEKANNVLEMAIRESPCQPRH